MAFRDSHTPQPNAHGDRPFSFVVDGRIYTDGVEAAPALAAAVDHSTEASLTAAPATGSSPSAPIAAYRGFEVTVRPAGGGTIRLGLRCPDRSDALEYATARTLDVAQVPAYGIGLFKRLDNLLDALGAELRAPQDVLAREETNLASYTDQLARVQDVVDVPRWLWPVEVVVNNAQAFPPAPLELFSFINLRSCGNFPRGSRDRQLRPYTLLHV